MDRVDSGMPFGEGGGGGERRVSYEHQLFHMYTIFLASPQCGHVTNVINNDGVCTILP